MKLLIQHNETGRGLGTSEKLILDIRYHSHDGGGKTQPAQPLTEGIPAKHDRREEESRAQGEAIMIEYHLQKRNMTKASIDDLEVKPYGDGAYGLYVAGEIARTPSENPVISKNREILDWIIEDFRHHGFVKYEITNGCIEPSKYFLSAYILFLYQIDIFDQGFGLPDTAISFRLKSDPIFGIWEECIDNRFCGYIFDPINKYLKEIGVPDDSIQKGEKDIIVSKLTDRWKEFTTAQQSSIYCLRDVHDSTWIISILLSNGYLTPYEFQLAYMGISIHSNGSILKNHYMNDNEKVAEARNRDKRAGKAEVNAQICVEFLKHSQGTIIYSEM